MEAAHVLPQRVLARVGLAAHETDVLADLLVDGALVAAAQPVHAEAEAAELTSEAGRPALCGQEGRAARLSTARLSTAAAARLSTARLSTARLSTAAAARLRRAAAAVAVVVAAAVAVVAAAAAKGASFNPRRH